MKKIIFLLLIIINTQYIYSNYEYSPSLKDNKLLEKVYLKIDSIYEKNPEKIIKLDKKISAVLWKVDWKNKYLLNSIHLHILDLTVNPLEHSDEVKFINDVLNKIDNKNIELEWVDLYENIKTTYNYILEIEKKELNKYIIDSWLKERIHRKFLENLSLMIEMNLETKYYIEYDEVYKDYISYNNVKVDDEIYEKSKLVKGILYNRLKSYKKITLNDSEKNKYRLDEGEYLVDLFAQNNNKWYIGLVIKNEKREYVSLIINEVENFNKDYYLNITDSWYYYFDFSKTEWTPDSFYIKIRNN